MKSLLYYIFTLFFCLFSFALMADNVDNNKEITTNQLQQLFAQNTDVVLMGDSIVVQKRKIKFQRGKAIIFCIFTGILGGHRIYFGTHQRTPIIYSVTLGGFGILPLVDLFNIIFTKDLSKFENKPEIMMWSK